MHLRRCNWPRPTHSGSNSNSFSAWAISFVILYATGSTLQTVIAGCGPAVIGITFMLITVRAALGWGPSSRPLALDGTTRVDSEDLALTAVRGRV